MEADFWLQRWAGNRIGFHNSEANTHLVKHFKELSLADGSRLFLPLCGKTVDIAWLLSKGYRVAGAELSEIAIEQLFTELGVEPKISESGAMRHYSAENIDIFVGDIFNLSGAMLGSVDAIYDRAALVALPEEMRQRYTIHLMSITDKAPQLLLCFVYDQNLVDGPPFSVDEAKVNQYYSNRYDLTLLETQGVVDGFKGKIPAEEHAWLLQ